MIIQHIISRIYHGSQASIIPYWIITDLITSRNLNVSIESVNRTDIPGNRYDGRIKEVQLVYGWNASEIKYWINEEHDPVTYYTGTYTGNRTQFGNVGTPTRYTARLWMDYLGNTSTTRAGYGRYYWNTDSTNLTRGCSGTGCYPPTTHTSGYYSGINYWTWNNSAGPRISGTDSNVLMYSRSYEWFKTHLAVFTIT